MDLTGRGQDIDVQVTSSVSGTMATSRAGVKK